MAADDPHPPPGAASAHARGLQAAIAAGVLLLAAALAAGAAGIPGEAGYAGIGPSFLPWAVAVALAVCGGWLAWEVATGGFRHMEEPSGGPGGDWPALAWVAAGLLANAALIERVGFVLSCALCYALAVRGLRVSEGRGGAGVRQALLDLAVGIAIAWPVLLLFTRVLGVSLPGLTGSGWL